jgi:hypothetical protein
VFQNVTAVFRKVNVYAGLYKSQEIIIIIIIIIIGSTALGGPWPPLEVS